MGFTRATGFVVIRPGAVIWVRFDPVAGREQGGRRPAVVVSSADHLIAASTLVTVVPVTRTQRGWPNHIPLTGSTGLDEPSFAMTEQVRTIARERASESIGRVDAECFTAICRWIHRWVADVTEDRGGR